MTMDGWYQKFYASNTPAEVLDFENTRFKNYLTIKDAKVTTGSFTQNWHGGRWNNCPGGSWWYYRWSAKFWVKDGADFTANTAYITGYYYQDGGISDIGTLTLDWSSGRRVDSRSAGTLQVNGGMMTIGTLEIAEIPDPECSIKRTPRLFRTTTIKSASSPRMTVFSVLFFIIISIPPPSVGGTNSNESVPTLYTVL